MTSAAGEPRVLFLGTGKPARSQTAEALPLSIAHARTGSCSAGTGQELRQRPGLVVLANTLAPADPAHLLTFDSVHGRWPHAVSPAERSITVDGKRIGFSACATPAYQPDQHHLLTAASCTTNCLAPLVKVLHEGIGIRHGAITTIHDATNTQVIVDTAHKDLRRARAAGLSLIPTSTGSATAIALIFPELKGKLNGMAVRVPLLNASLTDCVFEVSRPTTVEEVNQLFKTAAEGPLAGIVGYEERPLVSVNYKGDPRSGILDALSTLVIDGTSVKLIAWYDNEWGYANRLVELARKVGQGLR